MILYIAIFLILFCIVLSTVLLLTRSSHEENALSYRIIAVLKSRGNSVEDFPLNENSKGKKQRNASIAQKETLYRNSSLRKIDKIIQQAHVSTSVRRILGYIVICFLAAFLGTYFIFHLPLASSIGALCAAYLPIGYLQFIRKRRLVRFDAQLPACIDICARSLRAGHSIVAAIHVVTEQAVGPAKIEFQEVLKKQNYGLPLRDALLEMLDRVPSPDLRVFVTGILVQKDTGGNLVEILERTVSVIRERIRIQGEVRTNTAQGRLTGWILCLLPIFILCMINLMNPGYSSVLFHDPQGKKFLYIGLGLLTAGAVTIRQIVHGIEV